MKTRLLSEIQSVIFLTPKKLDWQDQSACFGKEEIFIYDDSRSAHSKARAREAKEICSTCPVFIECSTWAAKHQWHDVVVAGVFYTNKRRVV